MNSGRLRKKVISSYITGLANFLTARHQEKAFVGNEEVGDAVADFLRETHHAVTSLVITAVKDCENSVSSDIKILH